MQGLDAWVVVGSGTGVETEAGVDEVLFFLLDLLSVLNMINSPRVLSPIQPSQRSLESMITHQISVHQAYFLI